MKIRIAFVVLAAALFSACAAKNNPADPAQLSGTWSGHWGPGPDRQTEVVLELKWEGKALTGTINPGLRAIELSEATFDPQTRMTHMVLDYPISGGDIDHYSTDHYVIDGKVEDKTMRGTWLCHNGSGDFAVVKK